MPILNPRQLSLKFHSPAEPGLVLSILLKIAFQKENKIKQNVSRHHQSTGIDPQDKMCHIKVKTSPGARRSFALNIVIDLFVWVMGTTSFKVSMCSLNKLTLLQDVTPLARPRSQPVGKRKKEGSREEGALGLALHVSMNGRLPLIHEGKEPCMFPCSCGAQLGPE